MQSEVELYKTIIRKKSRKHIMLYRIMIPLIMSETIALIILDKSSYKILWITFMWLIIFTCIKDIFISPYRRRKYYKKYMPQKKTVFLMFFITIASE